MYNQLLINHKLQSNKELIHLTKVLQQKNFKIQFVDTSKSFLVTNKVCLLVLMLRTML